MVEFSVKRATLYRTGVGWFTAEGELSGDVIYFPVASSSLDDFLKTSLVGIKGGKASVKNLSFESMGITKSLFTSSNVVMGIIDFLRGSEVSIEVNNEIINGQILGYQIIEGRNNRFTISLLSGTNIRLIDGFTISKIVPKSEKDLSRLNEFLASLTNESDSDRQTLLRIELNETGEFTVAVSFLTSIPAWKLAYRLLINEDELKLDTFGIVDNNTLVDWIDADLVLSTKSPVSFKYDLSSPHEIIRPMIYRNDDTGISIPEPSPVAPDRSKSNIMSAKPVLMEQMMTDSYDEDDMEFGYEEQAAIELGESIEYVLKQPVTIKRKQSSMVPLSSDVINGKRVHYFNESNHSKHPFFVIELENNLDYSLDNGPISVFEHNNEYKGEAMLPRIGKNDEYLLSYALDKNISVSKDMKSHEYKERISIKGILLHDIYSKIQVYTFEMENKSDDDIHMYIAVPKQSDYKPLEKTMHGKKPDARCKVSNDEYRVIADIPAHSTSSCKFLLITELTKSKYLYRLTEKRLLSLLKDKSLSDDEKEIIQLVYDLGKQLINLNSERDTLHQKYERSKERRQQVIKTLEVLDKGSEDKTRRKYISEIESIDVTITTLLEQIESIDAKIKELERSQQDYKKLDKLKKSMRKNMNKK